MGLLLGAPSEVSTLAFVNNICATRFKYFDASDTVEDALSRLLQRNWLTPPNSRPPDDLVEFLRELTFRAVEGDPGLVGGKLVI